MELETNTPLPDEARLLAQSKKLTLEPVHANVTADDTPDAVVVGQHLAQGAIANIDADTEQNASPIVAADTDIAALPAKKDQARIYILTGIGFLLLVAVIVTVIIQL